MEAFAAPVNMNPAEALLLNCGTWAVITVLKLVTR